MTGSHLIHIGELLHFLGGPKKDALVALLSHVGVEADKLLHIVSLDSSTAQVLGQSEVTSLGLGAEPDGGIAVTGADLLAEAQEVKQGKPSKTIVVKKK